MSREFESRAFRLPTPGLYPRYTSAGESRVSGGHATDAEVADALRRIGAYERFARLPEGLGTDVQARGARLSSCEGQLLALGRISLADPSVVILDPATEAEVEGALRVAGGGRTLVPAARAARVAVMAHGRLVEVGSHEELLERGGRYAALWRLWAGEGRAI